MSGMPMQRGPLSGRYDPDVARYLHMQILNARKHFEDAVARRALGEQDAQMQLLNTQMDAMTPRVTSTPQSRAAQMIRF